MTRQNNVRDDAVSPVIGVMLMLVVTVVIAAVIAGFATGMAGDSTKTTPMALFEVEYFEVAGNDANRLGKNTLATFGLVHKGGDAIPLKDIQITLERVTDPTYSLGGVINTIQANYAGAMNPLKSPIQDFPLSVIGKGELESAPDYLGKFIYRYEDVTISAGDVLRVVPTQYKSVTVEWWEEDGESGVDVSISGLDEKTYVSSGAIVKWTLSYIPTNGIIAKGEFEVPYP